MPSIKARQLIPAEAMGIEGCMTIDSSTDDNGSLACARKHYPQAGADGTTTEAVDNLLGCLGRQKRIANIHGHGSGGVISTGGGMSGWDFQQNIMWWNHSSWQTDLQRLQGRARIIKLWGCNTGAGQEGVDLLDLVSQDTQAVSMAPTGFVYCDDGIYIESGSTWQIVVPGEPLPAPINAPTPRLIKVKVTDMKIYTGSIYEDIPVAQVTSIQILSGDGSRTITNLKASAAQDFVRTIDFESPFFVDAAPFAKLTARISIHFSQVAARQIGDSREFLVWNDRQLEDAANPGHFYSAPSGLRTFLRSVQ